MTTMEHEVHRIRGGRREHRETVAFELENVRLAAGSIFSRGLRISLLTDTMKNAVRRSFEHAETLQAASLACSWIGNRFFGHWLTDDCTLNLLGRDLAPPVVVSRQAYAHEDGYLRLFRLSHRKIDNASISSLFVFDDVGQNNHKRARYAQLRAAAHQRARSAPAGVMLLRGISGAQRVLVNEAEIAERLEKRGFVTVNAEQMPPDALVASCAGARCFVGVEGSALAHAVINVADGGAVVAIQPPWLFNNVFKDYCDCLGLRYGFVVGARKSEGYWIAPDDVEHTIDLALA